MDQFLIPKILTSGLWATTSPPVKWERNGERNLQLNLSSSFFVRLHYLTYIDDVTFFFFYPVLVSYLRPCPIQAPWAVNFLNPEILPLFAKHPKMFNNNRWNSLIVQHRK